jgi:ubiquinone/menaquinone biosynthesis C-methylase UbiE
MAADCVQVLYNTIGTGYNNTRRADPFLTQKLYGFLAPKPGNLFLDIGCGSGNYTVALADRGLSFYGVEPSEKMLELARCQNSHICWMQGTAEQMPAADGHFDGAIATLTMHHWTDLNKSMLELCRVLRPGGKLVCFTSTPAQMAGYWLNHYFPVMLDRSMRQMPAFERMEEALQPTDLRVTYTEKYLISDDLVDCFLYAGKNRPWLYLDENIRKGISSFQALANQTEVAQGLAALEADLANDQFTTIKERFNNDNGDYLFIIATKNEC